jgi:hypothetical protein
VPSAKGPHVAAAAAVGLALLICGCTRTQTTAARLQLNNTRLRAVSLPVRVKVGRTSASVTVSAKTILSTGGHFTAVVTLENHTGAAVSDLPLSVGYQVGAKTVYLNGATGLNYFDNHIPSIAAHGSLTWVDTGTAARVPRRARTFARVGSTPTSVLGSFTPPTISVSPASTAAPAAKATTLTVHLNNQSSIPQYQLPVYAVVTEGSRILAARDTSITELAGGAKAVVRIVIPASGTGLRNSVRVEAPATIFK